MEHIREGQRPGTVPLGLAGHSRDPPRPEALTILQGQLPVLLLQLLQPLLVPVERDGVPQSHHCDTPGGGGLPFTR